MIKQKTLKQQDRKISAPTKKVKDKEREFKRWLKVFLKEDAGILDELANR